MRYSDLLHLAFSGLWRQKTRTLLTLLGVALGACMLTFSLSIGQGVQDAVNAQFRRHDDLRRIHIYGGGAKANPDETGIPPREIEVKGEMSPERRARIRKMLIQQWHSFNTRRPATLLDFATFDRLREIPHVVNVRADGYESGQVSINGRSITTQMRIRPRGHELLDRLIVFGSIPEDDSRGVLIHEFQLYQLGLVDDAAIEKAIGRPVTISISNEYRTPRMLLALVGSQALTLSTDEINLLEKATRMLPGAIDKLDLSPAERASLRKLLSRRDLPMAPLTQKTVTKEFILAGVYRSIEPDEEKAAPVYERIYTYTELLLPHDAGAQFLAELPRRQERGFDSCDVLVDREENVSEVSRQVKDMGVFYYSPDEFVQQVLREIRLIRLATTFIALVALFVSGLGITNTMVTAVLERTREIGVMKAVGAKDRHILTVFLIEGALFGLAGCGLGLLTAWLFSFWGDGKAQELMQQQTRQPVEQSIFVFPVWLLISAPVFTTAITTLAALYPARRAAKVDPIVALRHE